MSRVASVGLVLQRICAVNSKQINIKSIKTFDIPLFSCYIFVKIRKSEYVPVLETEHVVHFVRFAKNLIAIPEAEINLVKQVIGEGLEVDVTETRFVTGDTVEIAAGNLVGLRGKLLGQQGKQSFIVELNHLGYSLNICVDQLLLRKVMSAAW